MSEQLEEVGLETHDPAQREQQGQSRQHGKAQAEATCLVAQFGGQAAHQDGDEDDVVHAQDDFKGGQHREGDPDVGVEQEVHDVVLFQVLAEDGKDPSLESTED